MFIPEENPNAVGLGGCELVQGIIAMDHMLSGNIVTNPESIEAATADIAVLEQANIRYVSARDRGILGDGQHTAIVQESEVLRQGLVSIIEGSPLRFRERILPKYRLKRTGLTVINAMLDQFPEFEKTRIPE